MAMSARVILINSIGAQAKLPEVRQNDVLPRLSPDRPPLPPGPHRASSVEDSLTTSMSLP